VNTRKGKGRKKRIKRKKKNTNRIEHLAKRRIKRAAADLSKVKEEAVNAIRYDIPILLPSNK
jgi:hypothetical protein